MKSYDGEDMLTNLSRLGLAALAFGLMLGAAQATTAGHLFHSTPPAAMLTQQQDVTGSTQKRPVGDGDITGSIGKPHKGKKAKKSPTQ